MFFLLVKWVHALSAITAVGADNTRRLPIRLFARSSTWIGLAVTLDVVVSGFLMVVKPAL